jgi:hypothetical protein
MDCNVLNLMACLDSSASCKVIFTMGNKKIIVCEEMITTTTPLPTSTPAETEVPTTVYPILNSTTKAYTDQNSTPTPSPYPAQNTPSPSSLSTERTYGLLRSQTQRNATSTTTAMPLNSEPVVIYVIFGIMGCLVLLGFVAVIYNCKKEKPVEPEPEPEPPAPDARHKTRNSWIVPVERQKRLMTIKECTTAEGKLSVMRNTKPRGTEHLKKQVRKLQAVNSINKKEGSK